MFFVYKTLEKEAKARKSKQNLAKYVLLKFAPRRLVEGFIILSLQTHNYTFKVAVPKLMHYQLSYPGWTWIR